MSNNQYIYIDEMSDKQNNGLESRHIMCDGIENLRDMGGILLCDGTRVIKSGKLFRSAKLTNASEKDASMLIDRYNLSVIIDLRTIAEAGRMPDNMKVFQDIAHYDISLVTDNDVGIVRDVGLRELLKSAKTLVKEPIRTMQHMYRTAVLDEDSIEALRKVFAIFLSIDDDSSVLWHCSAGKDRAGLVAALLLFALGADEDAVRTDYMATNKFTGASQHLLSRKLRFVPSDMVRNAIRKINSADEVFLNTALKAIKHEYGSVDNYLTNAIGLSDEDIKTLRGKYTKPVTS